MTQLLLAFLLTLIAGLSTGLGAMLAFFAPKANTRFLSICTGLSAGVMLFVSFVELFPEGIAKASGVFEGDRLPFLFASGAFFIGIAIIFFIDRFVPEAENPHGSHDPAEYGPLHDPNAPIPPEAQHHLQENAKHNHGRLLRMGLFTALAITIHNFPEGLATFLTALDDSALGIAITVAIALHNIPEGISVSVPIYYATGDRRKAFLWSCLSGLAEPAGALILWGILALCMGGAVFDPPQLLLGFVSAAVAGIMVFISLDELLPASRTYGQGHDSLIGLVAGMAVMALSLALL